MEKILACLLLAFMSVQTVPIAFEGSFSPVVQTRNGKLIGLRKEFKNGKIYDAFLGIPSAKPPVGTLRWERPLPPETWDGIREVTSYSHGCTTINSNSPNSEDCLYLNVFVPNGVDSKRDSPLPVMAWAHGGGFILGSARGYPGQELAITGDVIVVAFNYRLSTLGGLSTSDSMAPGNYHLWDARAALVWIKDNIKEFGGDSSRVTLFGQSAGGILSSHMALSPMTDGLIHRVISMSGNAASPVGLQYKSRSNAEHLANLEGCQETPTSKMIECLRQRDAHDLDLSGYISMVALSGTIPGWIPTVDGSLVLDKPVNVWNKGGAKNIDFMVGRTEDDASGFVYLNLRGEPRNVNVSLASDEVILDLVMRFLLQTYAPGDIEELLDVLKQRYPQLDSKDELIRTKAVSKLVTDWVWASSAHYEAQAHAKNAASTGKNTYLYNFKYRASFLHYAPWIQGSHSDMLHFTFGEPYRSEYRKNVLGNFSETDNLVKDNVMKFFSNFAHTGNPNKGPHKVMGEWPKYSPNTQEYMEISGKMIAKKEEKDLLERMNFWLTEWPKMTLPDSPQIDTKINGSDNASAIDSLAAVIAEYVKAMD